MFVQLIVHGASVTTRARTFWTRCGLSMWACDMPCRILSQWSSLLPTVETAMALAASSVKSGRNYVMQRTNVVYVFEKTRRLSHKAFKSAENVWPVAQKGHTNRNRRLREFSREYASQGTIFHGEKLMWHRPVESNAVGCSSRADTVIDFFAAYTAAVTQCFFDWPDNGQLAKVPIPLRNLDPHLMHGYLGPHESPTERHLDRFSRFCMLTNMTDSQTPPQPW